MNQTIYIAGKVTGELPEPTAAKFKNMQIELEAKGFDVVNPIEVVNNSKENWYTAMGMCLQALESCDAIFMMPCYKDSKGAKIELKTAKDLGIQVYYNLHEII
ncbi:DUF4406 domain-containing protein [Flavobacterium sp. LC2016-23]|uniref:DUF4406 domain-containing protein n=1 Tax=Flavobacterium sp. LC2016-23 TaxID=2666330 RepID=UPI0012AF4252|nr:DUF4406 domain-containing protein [Flavobacterium sp. LC2016-23]MRX40385.1 DUF4406 domain-containing protein [Flavobacterium sp. LC2016-23]